MSHRHRHRLKRVFCCLWFVRLVLRLLVLCWWWWSVYFASSSLLCVSAFFSLPNFSKDWWTGGMLAACNSVVCFMYSAPCSMANTHSSCWSVNLIFTLNNSEQNSLCHRRRRSNRRKTTKCPLQTMRDADKLARDKDLLKSRQVHTYIHTYVHRER